MDVLDATLLCQVPVAAEARILQFGLHYMLVAIFQGIYKKKVVV
ncbi:hypothetical protein E2C01_043936 [Portunus trituberculatus]|uniref:Uncharacterized protein n=1 Tax=Portunus trituberculatus TaxID=210409 RepID=A0A5B7G0V2_PORTR|nr:hypothetical protein [Portunus trituberculatus]